MDTEAAAAAGTESSASATATTAATGTRTGVSSGTASEAMIKAAMASEGVTTDTKPAASGAASAAAVTDTKVQLGADGKPLAQEPPKERWDDILKNARTKASEEALAPLAWAKDLKANEVQAAISLVNTLRKDPAAFWRELGEMVGSKAPAAEERLEAFPDPDLISSDGVKAYSADTLKKTLDIFGKQLMKQFQGELRPLMEFRDGEVQTREQAAAVRSAQTLAGQALTQARALPHFKEHEAAIVEKLQQMDPAIRKSVGPVAAMYMAFEQVKVEKVYPTLNAEAEKRVRAEYDKKAAASGVSVTSGDGKVREVPAIKGQAGLSSYMEKLAASNDPRFARA